MECLKLSMLSVKTYEYFGLNKVFLKLPEKLRDLSTEY